MGVPSQEMRRLLHGAPEVRHGLRSAAGLEMSEGETSQREADQGVDRAHAQGALEVAYGEFGVVGVAMHMAKTVQYLGRIGMQADRAIKRRERRGEVAFQKCEHKSG